MVLSLHIEIAVGGLFESKEFYITVTIRGSFEIRVLTHYNCCWGAPVKGSYILQVLLMAALKAECLHTAVSVRGPAMKFESRVLTHFSGVWGPFESRIPAHCSF